MYIGLQHLHSFTAYLTLAGILAAIAAAAHLLVTGRERGKADRITALAGMILSHLQAVLGTVLYFVSPLGFSNFSGEAMGDALSRLYLVEHPFAMVVGIVLVTVGYSVAKRKEEAAAAAKWVLGGYGLGLVLILSRIPWHAWF